MNRLTKEQQTQVVAALVEGNSIRSTSRMTGVARNTITSLLLDLAEACAGYHDRYVRNLRNLLAFSTGFAVQSSASTNLCTTLSCSSSHGARVSLFSNKAMRVFAWDSNPAIDHWLFKKSVARAEEDVATGSEVFITLPDGRRAVQLLPTKAQIEDKRCDSVGRNNLIPFGRIWDKLRAPNKLHYPIPAVGARNRPQYVSEINEPFCPA